MDKRAKLIKNALKGANKSVPREVLEYSNEQILKTFFWSPHTENMRLNFTGYQILKELYQTSEIELVENESDILPKHLLFLDRKIQFPYFLYFRKSKSYMVFFHQDDAMFLKLSGNSLEKLYRIKGGY